MFQGLNFQSIIHVYTIIQKKSLFNKVCWLHYTKLIIFHKNPHAFLRWAWLECNFRNFFRVVRTRGIFSGSFLASVQNRYNFLKGFIIIKSSKSNISNWKHPNMPKKDNYASTPLHSVTSKFHVELRKLRSSKTPMCIYVSLRSYHKANSQ